MKRKDADVKTEGSRQESVAIQAAIWNSLNHYNYADAIFLSDWLFTETGSDLALFLLATAYYRSGQINSAFILLKKHGQRSAETRFLYARCCFDLNKLLDAETTLIHTSGGNGEVREFPRLADEIADEADNAAYFALNLLGQIYSKTERFDNAAACFTAAVKLNPLGYSVVKDAAAIGVSAGLVDAYNNLDRFNQMNAFMYEPNNESFQEKNKGVHVRQSVKTPYLPSPNQFVFDNSSDSKSRRTNSTASSSASTVIHAKTAGRSLFGSTSSVISPFTPSIGLLSTESPADVSIAVSTSQMITPDCADIKPPVKAPRKAAIKASQVISDSISPKHHHSTVSADVRRQEANPSQRGYVLTQNHQVITRRSSRISQASIKENDAKQQSKPIGRPVIAATRKGQRQRKFSAEKSVPEANDSDTASYAAQRQQLLARIGGPTSIALGLSPLSIDSVMHAVVDPDSIDLGYVESQIMPVAFNALGFNGESSVIQYMKRCAEIEGALAEYDCERAIELVNGLSCQQRSSAWALSMLGRAYFELAQYEKAADKYKSLRRDFAHYIAGMELYSTALWHLKRDVELSALAIDLTENFKSAPETWCVVGNCFSLQKEHETAIKFIKRAVQVRTDFAYAFNLLGHEYIEIEEFEQAMQCFRAAIRANAKHYNAWCGIGKIYHRQDKLSLAEFHYRKALAINPRNSLIMCHISVIQQALKKLDPALQMLDQALVLSPRNPLCRYQRATVLFAQEQYEEALQELEALKQIVPKEARVYFLAGKIHKKLGQTHLALMNFSWATDLDPKGGSASARARGEHRFEEPMTALAAMELEDVGEIQAMESDDSL